MDRRDDRVNSRRNAGVISAAIGGALLALAGHLELIRRFGTVLPYRDQWRLTAIDLLQPFYEGRLGLREFFEPLNDHWPVLTRVLSFGLLHLNGQWNNLLETSLNAVLFAAALGVFLLRILPALPAGSRVAVAALTGIVFALPITWENTLWGIQSLVYLQIALTIIYLAAISTARTFSWIWWGGHFAGAAVLLTQHSGVLAHVAAALLLGWRWWRRDGERRINLAGFSFAVVAIISFAAFFPSITTTAALKADSWELALDVALRQLAWPLPHPAWAFFVYAPWLIWAINRFRAPRLEAGDAFMLACGLWVGGQAAAIGYGRAVDIFTFASRYCDFLALGFALNAACLARLWLHLPHRVPRVLLLLFAGAWLLAPVKSFWWESTESHARYNLERRAGENTRNLDRLKRYFFARDSATLLNDTGTQAELYTYAPAMIPLLERPAFQALLPPETGSPLARPDHGRLGWIPAVLLPSSVGIAAAGLLLLAVSIIRLQKNRPTENISTDPAETSWPNARTLAYGTAALFVASATAWRAWTEPDVFNITQRLNAAYAPLRPGVTFADLEFQQHDGDMHNMIPARGAVETLPISSRIFWYGTRLKITPDFRGVLRSLPFTVSQRYLIVPFTGYPCFPGNGLRVLFVDPATQRETWESYVGNDAATDWNLWTIDAAAHQGARASLFLFDGHEGASGWLGVARPAQTNDGVFASQWRAKLRLERGESTHRTLVGVTLATGIATLALMGWLYRKRRYPGASSLTTATTRMSGTGPAS